MTGTEVFMQDGAPCHTARSITTWLKDEANFPLLYWIGVTSTWLRTSGGSLTDQHGYGGRYKSEQPRQEDLQCKEYHQPEEGVPLHPNLLHAQPRGGSVGCRGWRQQVLSPDNLWQFFSFTAYENKRRLNTLIILLVALHSWQFWKFLTVFDSFWQFLIVFDSFWQLLTVFNSFFSFCQA